MGYVITPGCCCACFQCPGIIMPATLNGTFIGHRCCCQDLPSCTTWSQIDYSIPFTMSLIAGDPHNCAMAPLQWQMDGDGIVMPGTGGPGCFKCTFNGTLQWDCASHLRSCFDLILASDPACSRNSPPESPAMIEPLDEYTCDPLWLFFDLLSQEGGGASGAACPPPVSPPVPPGEIACNFPCGFFTKMQLIITS